MRTIYSRILLLPRFVRNLLVGAVMLGFNSLVLVALTTVGISATLAFLAKIPITWPPHYTLHRVVTWKERRHDSIARQGSRYVTLKIGTTLLGFALFQAMLTSGLHYAWANIVSFVSVGGLQYVINNKAVFINAVKRVVA